MAGLLPIDSSCTTCHWFVSHRDDDSAVDPGDCRRHAPTSEGWPTVSANDYCGDWQTDYSPLLRRPSHET
jgi:hypothetical protein